MLGTLFTLRPSLIFRGYQTPRLADADREGSYSETAAFDKREIGSKPLFLFKKKSELSLFSKRALSGPLFSHRK